MNFVTTRDGLGGALFFIRRQDVQFRALAAAIVSGFTVPCWEIIRIKSAEDGCPKLT